MNTPSPLIPQGSLQQHKSQGKSTVRIAVFTIIALHAFIFTGLLMQSGCRPDADKTAGAKPPGTLTATNDEVPKLDSGFYTSSRDLPSTNLPPQTNVFVPTDLAHATSAPPPALTTTAPPLVAETQAQAKEYTIVKGDTLGKIATAHGVTVAAINKANEGLEPTRLRIGQKIMIPAPAAPAASTTGGLGVAEPADGTSTVYVVKAGDTLAKIAKEYKTTIKAIKAANNMKTDRLLVGKKLKLPAPQKAGGASAGATNPSSTLMASPTSAPLSKPRQ
ncbi:MAG: LysM peptidoglycan-binding domain-containing protein [Verrucomicrobia bacterium]|nr:LysM peptidoglycan-binding domain-containing protein [Verrucomicrobiota bacterium]